jgi:hypothetical protein
MGRPSKLSEPRRQRILAILEAGDHKHPHAPRPDPSALDLIRVDRFE